MKIKELKNKKGVFNILVIGIALLIIINNCLFVSADENYILSTTYNRIDYLLNIEGYNESDLYNENLICRFGQSSYTDTLDINAINNMILPVISGAYSDYNYILCSDINNTYSLFLVDKDVKLFNSATGLTFVGFTSDIDNTIIYHSSYDSSYNFVSTTTYNFSIDSSVNPSYSYYNYSGGVILSSSGDIYISNYVNTNAIYNVSYAFLCLLNNDTSYIFENANYTYDLPPSVYPDGSGGTSANNLYLDGAEFRYNIPPYWGQGGGVRTEEPISNWGKGSVNFTADLNMYQINNSTDFTLNYTFYVTLRGSGLYWSTSREDKDFYGRFGPFTYSQTLTDFYNHGQNKSFNISDIFNNSTYSTFIDLDNLTVTDACNYIDGFDEIDNLQWFLESNVVLVSNNSESGFLSSTYNFVDRTFSNDDTSIRKNSNPYIDENGMPTNSTDDNNSSSSSSGGNTLINNDNDTVNFNGNGEVAQEIVNNLLPEDSNAGLTQDLQDTLNQNGWLPVVQTVFNFVPSGVWSIIEIYIVSGLGILAAFFVLRLILDLL